MLSFVYQVVRSVLRLIVWSLRSRDAQALEVMVLRHQLEVLDRQVGRARFEPQDRLLLAAASRLISRARWHVFSVRPETLLRWHHRLVTRRAARWGSKSRGRPPISRDLKNLIVRFAKDNPRWGYKRIQGELKKLGHDVSAMTIRDVLRRWGLGPAPRRAGPSWSEFLHAQASAILACDFFTVYGAWGRTIYVLFAIELSSRRVHLAGALPVPTTPGSPSRRETSRWRSPTPAPTFASSSTTETRSSPPRSTRSFEQTESKSLRLRSERLERTPSPSAGSNRHGPSFWTGCSSSESATSERRSANMLIITTAPGHTDHWISRLPNPPGGTADPWEISASIEERDSVV